LCGQDVASYDSIHASSHERHVVLYDSLTTVYMYYTTV